MSFSFRWLLIAFAGGCIVASLAHAALFFREAGGVFCDGNGSDDDDEQRSTAGGAGSRADFLATLGWAYVWGMTRPFTMVREPRVRFVYQQVRALNDAKVDGALVEAGVFRGGMVMTMALAQLRDGATRDIWLFDTFQGLTKPNRTLDGDLIADLYGQKTATQNSESFAEARRFGTLEHRWNWSASTGRAQHAHDVLPVATHSLRRR